MNFDRDGFYQEVGLRVQMRRKSAKLTQDEVARDLCMPRATYANVERGRQRVPIDVIWRLAVLFNVPVHLLLQAQVPLRHDLRRPFAVLPIEREHASAFPQPQDVQQVMRLR